MKRPTPLPNLLDAAYAAGLVVGSPLLAWRLARSGKWRSDWRGRLGHAPELPPDPRPTVLLHGVSVGEVAAAVPLVEALGGPSGHGPVKVVVSVTTNTGFERAGRLYGGRHAVVRYPLDFRRCVHRFLDAVGPAAVALMELELWPNFVRACQERGIPVVIVNGRLSERSFRGYRRLRPLVGPTFRRVAAAAVQSDTYALRFHEMGVPRERIVVVDSLKWEAPLPAGVREKGARLGREMGVDPDRPLVVGVSTGPGEESTLLSGRPEGVQLMVVPRKPERFGAVAALAPWVRRSEGGASRPVARPELFLVDTMGEAEAATALADVVVVGRSFNGLGGSNPVPAAQLGKPAVVGPDHENFADMVDALREGGALVVAEAPWPAVDTILGDATVRAAMVEAGARTVAAHSGATGRNLEVVQTALRSVTSLPAAEDG